MFRTSDLYVAAGLSVAGGVRPERMEVAGGIVYCQFDNPAIDKLVGKLEAGELLVDIRALRIEHIALKKKVFELIDKKGQHHEGQAH